MAVTPNLGNFSSLAALTSAFPASSVVAGVQAYTTDVGYVVGNGAVWVPMQQAVLSSQYGLVADGNVSAKTGTDNNTAILAWIAAATALAAISAGSAVQMVLTPGVYFTSGRHSIPGYIDLWFNNATLVASGTNITAPLLSWGGFGGLQSNVTSGRAIDIQCLSIISHTFTNRNCIGFQAVNKGNAVIDAGLVSNFTIGVQLIADYYCSYNRVNIGAITVCQIMLEENSLTVGTPFVSENTIRGGNVQSTSGFNNFGSCFGLSIVREQDTGYVGNSATKWDKASFQMGNAGLTWTVGQTLVAGYRYLCPLSGAEVFCKTGGVAGTVEPNIIPSGANLVTVTGITTVAGNAQVTMGSTTGLSAGMQMRGTNPLSNFPFDTYIVSVDDSTHVTLTNPAMSNSSLYRAYFIAMTTDGAATVFYVGPYRKTRMWMRDSGSQNMIADSRAETGVGESVICSGPYLFPQATTGSVAFSARVTLDGEGAAATPICLFPAWSATGSTGTAYALGDMVRPAVLTTVFWECIVGGAPGSTEPVPSSNNINTTFTDGAVTWIVRALPTTISRGDIGYYTGSYQSANISVSAIIQPAGPTARVDNLAQKAVGSAAGWLVKGMCKNTISGVLSQSFAAGDLALSREGLLLLSGTSELGFMIRTNVQKYFVLRKLFGAYTSNRAHLMPYDKAFVKMNCTALQATYNPRIQSSMAVTTAFQFVDPNDGFIGPYNFLVGPNIPYVFLGVVRGSTGTPVACTLSGIELTALSSSAWGELVSLEAQIFAPKNMNDGYRYSLGTPTAAYNLALGEYIGNALVVSGNPKGFGITAAGHLAPAWTTATYVKGQIAVNGSNVYAANGSFTAGTAPTGTGENILDGTASAIVSGDVATWDYIGPVATFENDATWT